MNFASPHAATTAQRGAATPPAARGHLALTNITKKFDASHGLVLDDVTVEAQPGEFLVVVGPSGCGKSTLLNIAAGIAAPDSGRASLDGAAIRGPGPDRAMVFQDHALFPWLTAAQNIELGLRFKRHARDERRVRVERALKMVRLSHAGDKLIHQLSGGMRQRVAIARALVVDPAVLLMDEPFAALDAQTRTLLHTQLQEVWAMSRKTVLFVTHSVGEAVRLGDRIIVLSAHPGRIRREFKVDIPHPRPAESPALAEIGHAVRTEIEDEVNRVNARLEAP